jgi:hypothetical protein
MRRLSLKPGAIASSLPRLATRTFGECDSSNRLQVNRTTREAPQTAAAQGVAVMAAEVVTAAAEVAAAAARGAVAAVVAVPEAEVVVQEAAVRVAGCPGCFPLSLIFLSCSF